MNILTPVTLWKDFDDTLPLFEELLTEREENGVIYREVYFLGRKTQYGRVKIFAKLYAPAGAESYPVVMILFEAGLPCDEKLVFHFLERGFGVLCVDYCGDMGDGSRHTIYPRDVDYANYLRAGRAMEYAEPTARETSWYEWAAVARFAARYLAEKEHVTSVGALGLRTGGEILWKIAPYAPIACMIPVCAAGWLAYRDMEKFGSAENRIFNEERHRFIAGIDSQSYAPHVKCPVLMISAINDKKCNYDRVYDTFQQINPEVDKSILFSAHGNGLIGRHSFINMDLFLDKFLRGRAVYLSKPVTLSVFEDEAGNLKAKAVCDPAGEPKECGLFFSEKLDSFKARDWIRVLAGAQDIKGNEAVFPLDVYQESKKVLLYTFVRYSNGFSVTSKIQEVAIGKKYRNARRRSRILYAGTDGTAGFATFRRRARSIADCFADGVRSEVCLLAGFGGILGLSTADGIISYRVSEPRYAPPENACFQFDAYSPVTARLKVTFYCDAEEERGYAAEVSVEGRGRWKNFLFACSDFKSETGAPMPDFANAVSVVFEGEGDVLVNNIKWL